MRDKVTTTPRTMTAEREAEIREVLSDFRCQECGCSNELLTELDAVQAAHQETQAKLDVSLVLNREIMCSYCGHRDQLPEGAGRDEFAVLIYAHIQVCNKSPFMQLIAAEEKLMETRTRLQELIEALEPVTGVSREDHAAWGKLRTVLTRIKGTLLNG